MSMSDAFWIAAAVTVIIAYFIGEKLLDFDLSGILPQNLKPAKLKRLRAERDTPLHGTGLHGDVREEAEKILLPLAKADKSLLPARMDMTFRREFERQLDSLKSRNLCREIRLADVVPIPKNDFVKRNDDGREWREAVLRCSTLERLIPLSDNKSVYEKHRKNAYMRILQSRHIRNSDRGEKKKKYYDDRVTVSCPSCGARVELKSQQTVCHYCGGVLRSDFYDWQTEIFEIYEDIGMNKRRAMQLAASSLILFLCMFLCLWLIKDTEISLSAGVGAAAAVFLTVFVLSRKNRSEQKDLKESIVRYSENYLRSCINDALYEKSDNTDLLSHDVGTVLLKKVVNTENTTEITVDVTVNETYLPKNKKPYSRKIRKTLTLKRARYPERRKADGELFAEKDCPSCGANFMPDEHGCCSFCGYGLRLNNAKWVII